jgi:hypothetical protein
MGGGGVQRILKFLKYWNYKKYDISVLTVKPSYAYAEDPSLEKEIPTAVSVYKSGTLDPFRFLFLLKKFLPGSFSVQNSAVKESGQLLRRLSNFFLLPDSRIPWLPLALQQLGRIHRSHPVDLVIATMPPFTAGIIANCANRLWKIPYLLDFRDAWTHNPYLPSVSALHQAVQEKLEHRAIHAAAGSTFVNPLLGEYYQEKYDILTAQNCSVVRNGYDKDDFKMKDVKGRDDADTYFKIGIMGTIYSQGNAPITFLEAFSKLLQKEPQLARKLQLIFIGKWTRAFHSQVTSLNIRSQVKFNQYYPHREALAFAREWDALALALHSGIEGSEMVTPGRIYEYLYLKKPILSMCPPNSDLANLIRENDAGEVVDYQDTQGILKVLSSWLREGVPKYSFKNLAQYDRKLQSQEMMKFMDQFL